MKLDLGKPVNLAGGGPWDSLWTSLGGGLLPSLWRSLWASRGSSLEDERR